MMRIGFEANLRDLCIGVTWRSCPVQSDLRILFFPGLSVRFSWTSDRQQLTRLAKKVRCGKMAEIVVDRIRKNCGLMDFQKETGAYYIAGILEEIAIGVTILEPNGLEFAEAERLLKEPQLN